MIIPVSTTAVEAIAFSINKDIRINFFSDLKEMHT